MRGKNKKKVQKLIFLLISHFTLAFFKCVSPSKNKFKKEREKFAPCLHCQLHFATTQKYFQ